MKKTIATLMVLLLLLSGCKAPKKQPAATPATPFAGAESEEKNNSQTNSSKPVSSEEPATEPVDDNWKEELGWDDSWTKLEPMPYEEAEKIVKETIHIDAVDGHAPSLSQENQMAHYVVTKQVCRYSENKLKKYGTEGWFFNMCLYPTSKATQPYEDYVRTLFALLEKTDSKFKNFSIREFTVSSTHLEPPKTDYPFLSFNCYSDPQITYTYEDIEDITLEVHQFFSSFEGVSHLLISCFSANAPGASTNV